MIARSQFGFAVSLALSILSGLTFFSLASNAQTSLTANEFEVAAYQQAVQQIDFVQFDVAALNSGNSDSGISDSLQVPTANSSFPIGPDPKMTPGALCTSPTAYRYAEHIAYCERNVDGGTKADLIHQYDVSFGYKIESMDRQKFKIDHFIPLCAGGANSVENLWPQHESVYTLTDPLEAAVCEKMSAGRLLQKDAIQWIRQAKLNLSQAASIIAHVQSL